MKNKSIAIGLCIVLLGTFSYANKMKVPSHEAKKKHEQKPNYYIESAKKKINSTIKPRDGRREKVFEKRYKHTKRLAGSVTQFNQEVSQSNPERFNRYMSERKAPEYHLKEAQKAFIKNDQNSFLNHRYKYSVENPELSLRSFDNYFQVMDVKRANKFLDNGGKRRPQTEASLEVALPKGARAFPVIDEATPSSIGATPPSSTGGEAISRNAPPRYSQAVREGATAPSPTESGAISRNAPPRYSQAVREGATPPNRREVFLEEGRVLGLTGVDLERYARNRSEESN